MELICYQAGKGENPENTILAIKKCLNINPEFTIHVDLQYTKDGEIVLFKKQNTLSLTGKDLEVSLANLQDLEHLNVAFNYSENGEFPYRNEKIKIPTLKNVFKLFPDTKFLLDMQSEKIGIVEELINIIDEFKMNKNVTVTSVNKNIITLFNNKTNIQIAATTIATRKFLYENVFYLDSIIPIDADLLIIPKSDKGSWFLRKNIINYCKQNNKKTWVWIFEGNTITSEFQKEQINQLKENGADGVFTVFPSKLNEGLFNDINLISKAV